MALELNGTTGVSLVQDGVVTAADLASGAITSAALPTGSVLQVVSATGSDGYTSSSSFVTTGHSVTITPKSTSSKILLLATSTSYKETTSHGRVTIYRGGTNLGDTADGLGGSDVEAGAIMSSISYLDTPATTSATTYTIYYRSISDNFYWIHPWAGGTARFTALEIAG